MSMKGWKNKMKNRKKIMCQGLAFGDKEDMEMLHNYALEGWVFRELKGVSYILHKEEPKDLIFTYDFCKINKENEEEYYEMFENAGWQPIECKDKTIHFFCGTAESIPVHTDKDIQANQFKSLTKWSLITFLISMAILAIASQVDSLEGIYGGLQVTLLLLSAGMMGGSGMCFVGCFLRTRKKRLSFNISMKATVITLIVCMLSFLAIYFCPWKVSKTMASMMSLLAGLSLGGGVGALIGLIFKYPSFRDGKTK